LQARQPHWIESHVISTTTPVRRSEPAAIPSIFYPPAMSRNRSFPFEPIFASALRPIPG
jgi:hypothetical protein